MKIDITEENVKGELLRALLKNVSAQADILSHAVVSSGTFTGVGHERWEAMQKDLAQIQGMLDEAS